MMTDFASFVHSSWQKKNSVSLFNLFTFFRWLVRVCVHAAESQSKQKAQIKFDFELVHASHFAHPKKAYVQIGNIPIVGKFCCKRRSKTNEMFRENCKLIVSQWFDWIVLRGTITTLEFAFVAWKSQIRQISIIITFFIYVFFFSCCKQKQK